MNSLLLCAACFAVSTCLAQARQAPALEQAPPQSHKLLESLATEASPEPFIQELYRELQQLPTADAFSGGQGASGIYANPLLSSVHKEYWGSKESFAGQLDYSPLCVCKNPAGFTLSPITFTPVDKSHMDATFTLHYVPPPAPHVSQDQPASPTAFPEEPEPAAQVQDANNQPAAAPPDRRIILHLVHREHGWRVDDIASSDVPSMKLLMLQRHPESETESASDQQPQKP